MITILDLVGVVVVIVVGYIAYYKWKFTYWEKKGVQSITPEFPFGNSKDAFFRKISSSDLLADMYREFKRRGLKHGGGYSFSKPYYIPVDPEIIKNILQRDFEHFMNHGNFTNIKDDPLSGHLFNLEDTKWRNMRVKMTPTFTSGKMKMMFQTLADCAKGLKQVMDVPAGTNTAVEIKDILARFTTDIIGSCAFGLECNSLKDPDGEFRKYGRKIFQLDRKGMLRIMLLSFLPPWLLKLIKFQFTDPEVEKFFLKVVEDTVNYREQNQIVRKDFMHMLIQLKNRGSITDDDRITGEQQALTMEELAAQAFVFFLAGFETSSTTMTFALFELATNPDIQQKVRDEINMVLAKTDGKLTYERIMEMTYMDKVLKETLRKHPPVPFLLRICTKDYTIPGTEVHLEKGTSVRIATMGLHMDPEHFPEPEKFDPERFSEENKNKRHQYTWLPFGEGPRICIGLRFGMLQSKVGLVTLLRNYEITLNRKTKLPLEMDKKALLTSPKGGIWLDVKKLDK